MVCPVSHIFIFILQIESRISEEYAKKKELEKKRAEGEVSIL